MVNSKSVSIGVAIDVSVLPKLVNLPCRGVLNKIRVSVDLVFRHPDFIISITKYQLVVV